VSFCSDEELDYLREIEKTIRMSVPIWEDHDHHEAGLAERYARGGRGAPPKRVQQQGRRSFGGGGGQGRGGRRPSRSGR
jgi:ATP-dependent RNA helicase RhlE